METCISTKRTVFFFVAKDSNIGVDYAEEVNELEYFKNAAMLLCMRMLPIELFSFGNCLYPLLISDFGFPFVSYVARLIEIEEI